MKSYEPESYESVADKLGIPDASDASDFFDVVYSHQIYRNYKLIGSHTASIDKLISILSETSVYKNIFDRMVKGQAVHNDWLVLLGIFGCFADGTGMLIALFERYPNYDVLEA